VLDRAVRLPRFRVFLPGKLIAMKPGALILLFACGMELAIAQEPTSRPVAESRSLVRREFLGLYQGEAKIGSGVMEHDSDPVSGTARIAIHGSVNQHLVPDWVPLSYSRVLEFDAAGLLASASETIETARPVTKTVVVEERSVKNGPSEALWKKITSRRSADGKSAKPDEENRKGPPLRLTLAEHERHRVWIKGGASAGATLTQQRIDFGERKVRWSRIALLKRTAAKIPGIEPRTAICTETDDAHRTTLKAFGPEGSIAFLELANGWIARGEPDGLAQSAIGWDGNFAASILPKAALSSPGAIKRVDLILGGNGVFLIESLRGHKVARGTNGIPVLRLDVEARSSDGPGTSDRRRWTEPTAEVPALDREIVGFAKEAAKHAASSSAHDVVVALIGAVRETVSDGMLPPGLSAAQVLEQRRGGSRGRALLLVAAARSLKMPAREVRGLAYRVEDVRLFVPHWWVEIEMDDFWEAVDPTFGQIPADILRLRLRSVREGDPIPDPIDALTIDLKP
jgi:hypothetical protein